MSPAHVLEPTYQRLKRELVAGTYPMGSKLEALRLAEDFGVSMTPVRDSLNQLTGEGLVERHPGEGFRVGRLTEQSLRELLELNHLLLLHAVGTGPGVIPGGPGPVRKADDYPARIAAIFVRMAAASGNRVLVRYVEQIGERLGPARNIEPDVIPDAHETLRRLEAAACRSASDCLFALSIYQTLCIEAVPRLIASMRG